MFTANKEKTGTMREKKISKADESDWQILFNQEVRHIWKKKMDDLHWVH